MADSNERESLNLGDNRLHQKVVVVECLTPEANHRSPILGGL
jgi:hypothetical protein